MTENSMLPKDFEDLISEHVAHLWKFNNTKKSKKYYIAFTTIRDYVFSCLHDINDMCLHKHSKKIYVEAASKSEEYVNFINSVASVNLMNIIEKAVANKTIYGVKPFSDTRSENVLHNTLAALIFEYFKTVQF